MVATERSSALRSDVRREGGASLSGARDRASEALHVERHASYLRDMLAVLAAIVAGAVVMIGWIAITPAVAETFGLSRDGRAQLAMGSFLAGAAVAWFTAVSASSTRRFTIYRDESRRDRMVEAIQERKFQPFLATYAVRDVHGVLLARLTRNRLAFRRRWRCDDPNGRTLCVADRSSVAWSPVRATTGSGFALSRAPDVRLAASASAIDDRIAIAIGVVFDARERR